MTAGRATRAEARVPAGFQREGNLVVALGQFRRADRHPGWGLRAVDPDRSPEVVALDVQAEGPLAPDVAAAPGTEIESGG